MVPTDIAHPRHVRCFGIGGHSFGQQRRAGSLEILAGQNFQRPVNDNVICLTPQEMMVPSRDVLYGNA